MYKIIAQIYIFVHIYMQNDEITLLIWIITLKFR